MFRLRPIHLAFFLVFFSNLSVFGQWALVSSGTTSNLNGAHLLDSGTGFVVGDTGTILKSTDAGATWTPLTSGTTITLHGIYFFDANAGVAVGEQGLILRTTDGGAVWDPVASGVGDALRSVSFSGVNESVAATRKLFFSQRTQAHRGRSGRVDSLAADSRALRC